MRQYLTNKKVLSVQNNAKDFLHGLTSNDLDQPMNAFLNIHGRIIATFDQIQVNEDFFLLCMEAPYTGKVLEHLEKYAKLSGTHVALTDLKVYFDLDNTLSLEDEDQAIEQEEGKLVLTKRDLESTVSEEEFTMFRLRNNLPLQGIDFTDEMLLNVSTTHYVSFTKGCFLGQEPISKVYNRSKPTWRLVSKLEKDCTEEEKGKMTSKVVNPQTDELMGFVFEKNG